MNRREFLKKIALGTASVAAPHTLFELTSGTEAAQAALTAAKAARKLALTHDVSLWVASLSMHNLGVHFTKPLDRSFLGQAFEASKYSWALNGDKSLNAFRRIQKKQITTEELNEILEEIKNSPTYGKRIKDFFEHASENGIDIADNMQAQLAQPENELLKENTKLISEHTKGFLDRIAREINGYYWSSDETLRTQNRFKAYVQNEGEMSYIEVRVTLQGLNSTDFGRATHDLCRLFTMRLQDIEHPNTAIFRSRTGSKDADDSRIKEARILDKLPATFVSNIGIVFGILERKTKAGAPSKPELTQGSYDEFGAYSRQHLQRQREDNAEYCGRY